MDIRSLKAVVGLVCVGKRWGIIDRQLVTAARDFVAERSWEARAPNMDDGGGLSEADE